MKIKQQIPSILADYANKMSIVDIAKKYNVDEKTIHLLFTGETYKGVGKIKEKDPRSQGKSVILQINGREVPFKTIRSLSKVLGLDESSISNILVGKQPIPVIENIRYA